MHNTILIVVNRFIKMSHFVLMRKDLFTKKFTHLFIQEIVKHHTIPALIVNDHSFIFTLKF